MFDPSLLWEKKIGSVIQKFEPKVKKGQITRFKKKRLVKGNPDALLWPLYALKNNV